MFLFILLLFIYFLNSKFRFKCFFYFLAGLDWIAEFAIKKEADEKAKKAKEELDQRLKREAKLQELRNNLRPVYKGKRKVENSLGYHN